MATPSELTHFHNGIQEALALPGHSATEIEELEKLRTAVDDATSGNELPEPTRIDLVERFGEPPSAQ